MASTNAIQQIQIDPVNSVNPTDNRFRLDAIIQDPTTPGAQAAVLQLHNSDNQAVGASTYALVTGGTQSLINAAGNADRQRESGTDQVSALGLPADIQLVALEVDTNCTTTVAAATTAINLVVTSSTSFVVGGTANFEPGTTRYEAATITAIPDATHVTVAFPSGGAKFTHTATYVVQTFLYSQARQTPGATGVQAISTEGTKATYSLGSGALTIAAATTDAVTIKGSASKTIRVTRISIAGNATAAAPAPVNIVVRSTADTGGAGSTPTPVPHDSNDAAATAVVNLYTANPGALGTLVGNVRSTVVALGTLTAGPGTPTVLDFTTRNAKGIVLRGAAQQLCVNLLAQTYSGAVMTFDIEWTEE